MCRTHWSKVPTYLQRRVWTTYRSGQCDDKSPSMEWHAAADAAIGAAALRDGFLVGELSVGVVRALVELAPSLLGDDLDRIRTGLNLIDRKRKAAATSS